VHGEHSGKKKGEQVGGPPDRPTTQ